MKGSRHNIFHYVGFLSTLTLLVMSASGFTGPGSGTSSDPYEISNLSELNQTREDLSAHYELVSDINASETRNWNSGKGFKPISNFKGTLNGNSHEIFGLYIDRTDYLGLFKTLSGTVRKLGINATVKGTGRNVAILSAEMEDGSKVDRVYTSGYVETGDYQLGAIAAELYDATIIRSFSNATVNGLSGSNNVGGLVGWTTGGINNNPEILKSYATGSVSGDNSVGGILGYSNSIDSSSSYWNIDKTGQSSSAGDGTGLTDSEMKQPSNFNSWNFSVFWSNKSGCNNGYPALREVTECGGDGNPTIKYINASQTKVVPGQKIEIREKVFWDKENVTYRLGDGRTISRRNPTFSYSSEGIYEVELNVSNGTHDEKQNITINVTQPLQGSGTESDPYIISSCSDLQKISLGMSSHYKLNTSRIDCSDLSSDYDGFEPIGPSFGPEKDFSGEINLTGVTISNLKITHSGEKKRGLFQVWNSSSDIKDFRIENATYIARPNVSSNNPDQHGLLAGKNYGNISIKNTSIEAKINISNGASKVGGLIGRSEGNLTIKNSKFNVSANLKSYTYDLGGVIGYIKSNLTAKNSEFYLKVSHNGTGYTNGIAPLVGRSYYQKYNISLIDSLGKLTANMPELDRGSSFVSEAANIYGENLTVLTGKLTVESYGGVAHEVDENATLINTEINLGEINITERTGTAFGIVDNKARLENIHARTNMSFNYAGCCGGEVGGLIGDKVETFYIINSSFEGSMFENINRSEVDDRTGGLVGDSDVTNGDEKGVIIDSWVKANMTVEDDTGGLVGDGYEIGRVVNSSYEGIINMSKTNSDYRVGGLISESDCCNVRLKIVNSSSKGKIISISDVDEVGGLLGSGKINITNSNSSMDIIATESSSSVGGLIGRTREAYIHASNASGDIESGDYSGGLVGEFDGGLINYSHATGNVNAPEGQQIGGLVGQIDDGLVNESYATGNVEGKKKVGGLVGWTSSYDDWVSNSYAAGNVEGEKRVGGLIGEYEENLTDSYATGDVRGRDQVGGLIGALNPGENTGNEYFIRRSYATGDVSGTNKVGGLVGKLAGNLTEVYYEGSVTGEKSVGGVAGTAVINRNITGAYSTGEVTGLKLVGGLIGDSKANINSSYSGSAVKAGSGVAGGLIGRNNGTVNHSYARGNVYGALPGGLVGKLAKGIVENSYSTGPARISSSEDPYRGLTGSIGQGEVKDSYWDTESSGTEATAGNAEGLTTEEMKNKSKLAKFNFSRVWNFQNHSNSGYPVLKYFNKSEFLTGSQAIIINNSDKVEITIEPGRNFISLPITSGSPENIKEVFNGSKDKISSIWTYNGSWISSRPWDADFNSDFNTIEGGKGYLVYSNASTEFRINFKPNNSAGVKPSGVKLKKSRWNLIGSYSTDVIFSYARLFNVLQESKVDLLSYRNQEFKSANSIKPGKAYWLSSDEDRLYKPDFK